MRLSDFQKSFPGPAAGCGDGVRYTENWDLKTPLAKRSLATCFCRIICNKNRVAGAPSTLRATKWTAENPGYLTAAGWDLDLHIWC